MLGCVVNKQDTRSKDQKELLDNSFKKVPVPSLEKPAIRYYPATIDKDPAQAASDDTVRLKPQEKPNSRNGFKDISQEIDKKT